MRRHWDAGHDEGVRAEKLGADLHVLCGVDECVDAAIEERPPLAGLAPFGVGGTVAGRRDGLPAELVGVRLESPEAVAGDVWVGLEGFQYGLEIVRCRPVGDVP